MKAGQKFGLIGRLPNHQDVNDMIPFVLNNPLIMQTPAFRTAYNWVTPNENQILAVMLIYSEDKKIFDR